MLRRNSAAANRNSRVIHGSRESLQWQDQLGAAHSRNAIRELAGPRLHKIIGSATFLAVSNDPANLIPEEKK